MSEVSNFKEESSKNDAAMRTEMIQVEVTP